MTNPESKAAAILGRKGGLSRSEDKVRAAKENGKKGGAPKKVSKSSACPRCGSYYRHILMYSSLPTIYCESANYDKWHDNA